MGINYQGLVAFVLGMVGGFLMYDVQRAYPFDTYQTQSSECSPLNATSCKRVPPINPCDGEVNVRPSTE